MFNFITQQLAQQRENSTNAKKIVAAVKKTAKVVKAKKVKSKGII